MAKLVIFGSDGRREVELVEHNTIGRLPRNTIQVLDRIVSKEHCVIYLDKTRGFVFKDLGSLNGSYVNKDRVQGEIELHEGDEIILGNTRCMFLSEDAVTDVVQQPDEQHDEKPSDSKQKEPADPFASTGMGVNSDPQFTASVLCAIRDDGPLSTHELLDQCCPAELSGKEEQSRVVEMTRSMKMMSALNELEGLGLIEHNPGREYQATDRLKKLQVALGISLTLLIRPKQGRTIAVDSESLGPEVRKVREQFEDKYANEWYGPDIASDLREIAACLDVECYRAALSVAGRAMELTLKLLCDRYGVHYQDDWMVGKLLGALPKRMDSNTKNIGNIINDHRKANVHSHAKASRPTRDQANMVCHALLDIIRRHFLNGGGA